MQKRTDYLLRFCLLAVSALMTFAASSCAKAPPRTSCDYLINLLGNEEKSRDIENWLEYIFDNPDRWREYDGRRLRGMGAFHIAIPNISSLEEMGLPPHTRLIASKDSDGNVTYVVAAVAQWVGIVFSKDKSIIDFEAIPENKSENMGIMCLERD